MAMISDLGFPAFFGVILGLFEFIGGILMIIGLFANYIAAGFIIIMLGAFIYCSSVTRLYDIWTCDYTIGDECSCIDFL